MCAGNKKLCGAPLGAKCEATPPPAVKAPVPSSDKDAAASTGASADDAKQAAQKPVEGVTSYGVLAAVLGTLAIVDMAFVTLHNQRQRDKTTNMSTWNQSKGTPILW